MVKKNNGFTKFPNFIYDYILGADLTATQLKIILAVVRNTHGWGEEFCKLSVSKLESITNCSNRQIKRDVKELVNKEILIVEYSGRDRYMKVNESVCE